MAEKHEKMALDALNRLREDLAYAAPEIWMLHIERRFTDLADMLSEDDEDEVTEGG